MKIASPLLAVLLAAVSVVLVRQAKGAWRDPNWKPGPTTPSPRSVVAAAALMVSTVVFFAGASVAADVPGAVAQGTGASLAAAGVLGILFAAIAKGTTTRLGRPRFLVPPPLRRGYEQAVPSGRDHIASGTDGEFIVIAGQGSHVTGAGSDAGRLVLTTRRLVLSTQRGTDRSWPVAQLRAITAGPGDTAMTLKFTDGREEVFTAAKHRDLWLSRVAKLVSLPRPVTSWYGDPAGADRPVAVPDGAAVVVLWRADGERPDRWVGYRVLLDDQKVAKIRAGKQIELPIPPGRHVISLRSLSFGSRLIPFEARAGQVLRFACEPGAFPGMTQPDMQEDVTGYIRLRLL